jgi:hypothetical protein
MKGKINAIVLLIALVVGSIGCKKEDKALAPTFELSQIQTKWFYDKQMNLQSQNVTDMNNGSYLDFHWNMKYSEFLIAEGGIQVYLGGYYSHHPETNRIVLGDGIGNTQYDFTVLSVTDSTLVVQNAGYRYWFHK